MNLIASVVDKCFLLKERGLAHGMNLDSFIANVETQIERLNDTEVLSQPIQP